MARFLSDPSWLPSPPCMSFIGGMFLLSLGVIYTYTGKVWARYRNCWVHRADEPKRYWSEVVVYYLLGLGLIGLFLYEVHAFSS